MMVEEISRLYRLLKWPEDPESGEGRRRYAEALERFRKALSHEWFSELLSKKRISIADVCGGTGIGGVALAKVMQEAGVEVELTVIDLRKEALKRAETLSEKELGKKAKTELIDARELHSLKQSFDLALLYGYSTPHFDPWKMARLLASTSSSLRDEGLMIIEEQDRQYLIFYKKGYKDFLVEDVGPKRFLISVHFGYDKTRGVFRRAIMDQFSGEGPMTLEVYFWSLADLMAMTWLFFEDVDFLPYERSPFNGLVLAKRPREKLKPGSLKTPRVLEKEEIKDLD